MPPRKANIISRNSENRKTYFCKIRSMSSIKCGSVLLQAILNDENKTRLDFWLSSETIEKYEIDEGDCIEIEGKVKNETTTILLLKDVSFKYNSGSVSYPKRCINYEWYQREKKRKEKKEKQ